MKRIVVFLCVCVLHTSSAFADSFMVDENGVLVNIRTNSVVGENVRFQPELVNVYDTIKFVNNGFVDSTFSICSRCQFVVRNRGDFAAKFVLGEGADVVLVVSEDADWNPIESNAKYTLMIDGFKGNVSGNVFDGDDVSNVILKDAVLNISDVRFMNDLDVCLYGDNILVLDDSSGVYDGAIMTNVSGDGRVHVVNNNQDVMYADVAHVIDNQLFVKRVRETDYKKIFDNDLGLFLNNLRGKNSDDVLLRALDVARDMDSLDAVMARSVRMNPDLLLRTVRILSEFNKFTNYGRTGVNADFDMVFSDDFYSYGAGVGLSGNFERLKLKVGLYVGDMAYESDLDNFNGIYYGLSMGADYLMKNNLFVRGMANVMRFDFDIGDVFYNGEIINNPSAIYFGGVADFGYRHEFADLFYVAPFVGADVIGTIVADVSDVDVRGRVGMDVGYSVQVLGLSYDYGVGVNANSDNEIVVNARAGVWSEYDGAGANIGFAVSRMFDIYSYKISIDGRVWF